MNTIRRIAKNTLVLLISKVTIIFFGFFYTIYAARYLGVEGFGVLSFAIAFTGIIVLLADIGIKNLTIREIARDKTQAAKYLGNISILKLLLVLVTFFVVIVVSNFLGYPHQTTMVIYIITASFVLRSFSEMFYSIFQAFEKMEYASLGGILDSILMFFGVLIAIKLNLEIVTFVTIYLITSIITLLYSSFICIHKFAIPQIEVNLAFWKQLLEESIPFWLTSVFIIIYFRIDMVMLSVLKNDMVVGWYAAPYRLVDSLSLLPSLIMAVMYPLFSKYYINSTESLNLAFQKSLKILIIIALPIGLGTTLLAKEIILLIYGSDYFESIIALQVLAWAGVLGIINFTPATLLNSINKQRPLMIFTFIGATVNIILNFLLIPTMSYVGAGIATIITEFIVGVLILYEVYRFQPESLIDAPITIAKSVTATIFMGFFIFAFKQYTILLLIPLAAILYFILLFMLKILRKDEYILVKQIFKK